MSPIEHAYAEEGAAFTLRFHGDALRVDVILTGSVVGHLFARWLRMPDREGVLELPVSPRLHNRTDEPGGEGREVLNRAAGGVRVRVVTADEEIKVDVSGGLGPENFNPDPAAEGHSDRWPTNGIERHSRRCSVGETDGKDDVAIGHSHLNRSEVVMRAGVEAESGPGETSAPAKRGAAA